MFVHPHGTRSTLSGSSHSECPFAVFLFVLYIEVIFHRTLRRLSKMRRLVEMHALRPRHKRSVLTKLEQHEAKLADLASKFTVSRRITFDSYLLGTDERQITVYILLDCI
jgi:hypothetical protein